MAITSSIIPSFRSPIIGGGLFSRARISKLIRPKISNMRSMIDGLKPIIKSPIGEGGVLSRASNFIRPKISNVGSMINNLRPNTDQRGQGQSKNRFLSNFMGFGSKRNEKKIKRSMKLLRNILVETFEIAKILRVGVQKTAEQLKGLSSGKGGGGGGFLGGLFGGLLGGLLFGGGPILLAIKAIIAGAIVNWLGEKFFPETTERIKNWIGSKVKGVVDAYLPTAIMGALATLLAARAFPGAAKTLVGGGVKAVGKTALVGGAAATGLAVGSQMGGDGQGMGVQSVGITTKLLEKFDSILDRFSTAITSFSTGAMFNEKEGDTIINVTSDSTSNVSNVNSQSNNLINNSTTNNNISNHINNIKNGTNGTNVTFVPYNVNANNNQPSAVSPIINPSPSPNNSEDFAFYTSHNPDSYSDFETKLMYNIVEA